MSKIRRRQNPSERYQSIPALRRAIALRRHLPVAAAAVFNGEYLLSYVRFRDSLPEDQRLACEEIFAEQSAVLDSILLSLPGSPGR